MSWERAVCATLVGVLLVAGIYSAKLPRIGFLLVGAGLLLFCMANVQ